MITVRRTEEFAHWLSRLRDTNARARIILRIDRIISTGNLGDVKFVGQEIYEIRIKFGPGYRVYYKLYGDQVILLLIGGDKSNQQRDIEYALRLALEYE